MRSRFPRVLLVPLLLGSLSSVAWAQTGVMPSLLPLPPLPHASSQVAPAAAMESLWHQGQAPMQAEVHQGPTQHGPIQHSPVKNSPVQQAPSDKGMSGDYFDAMKGGYEGSSCTTCNSATGCGGNHYIYANALLMTHDKRGGFVTSLDAGSGTPEVFFCSPEFGRLWHGGFEIGTGWCFGCDNNSAVEVVYWGLFADENRAAARGNLDSTIDFGDLNYNGGNANLSVTGAQIQEVRYDFDFNNVEINLVGNGCCGGPFGCGMCGCCNGRAGSPWGFGWLAGFRYINFSENFLFSSDTTDDQINGDPTELTYNVQLNNNLFGFQLGTGLSYCVTNSLTAYAIGKMGIYNNYVTQTQRVFGPAGSATINNGPNTGNVFLVDAEDDDVAFTGQLDLGGRWAINDQWSVNFGYRALGLAGVAISETNVQRNGFQNLLGIADTQTDGSFILHGGYAGATYCW